MASDERGAQSKPNYRIASRNSPIIRSSSAPRQISRSQRPITKEKLFPSPPFEQTEKDSTDMRSRTTKVRIDIVTDEDRKDFPPLPGRLNRKTRSDASQFTRNRITCNYRAREGGRRIAFGSLAFSVGKLRIFVRGYGHFARASNRWRSKRFKS